MQQYCLYLRKSRADIEAEAKGEMETLARHEKALLELAKKMNLSITQIYREIVSGDSISARPVVQQLLSEVEQCMWTGVLVMEVERLARGDTIDQGIVARAFKMGEAKIITPVKIYDPNNEFDEEYFEFGLFMSRREYKTINRRLQRGRVASAKEGKAIISTPPYGYEKKRLVGEKGFVLIPNEKEADAVKIIYDLYNKGCGMMAIAKKLDEMHIKPRIGDYWSKATINDILKNPVYLGKIRWAYNVEKKINVDGSIIKKRFRNEDAVFVDGLHSPLISEDDFDKAQQQRINNTHKRLNKDMSLKNPLSGLIYCKVCGGMLTRLGPNHHTPYDTIVCPNRYCGNVSSPLISVENALIVQLEKWLNNYTLEMNTESFSNASNTLVIKLNSLKSLQDELLKVEKQISQTYDLVESGVYTTEIFIQRNKDLAERKNLINKSIETIEDEIRYEKNIINVKEKAIPLISSVLQNYYEIDDVDEKNKLLKLIISRVEYLKTQPNIRGKAFNENFNLVVFPKLPK